MTRIPLASGESFGTYETQIQNGSHHLDTITLVSLHPDQPQMPITNVSTSVLLQPTKYVTTRNERIAETASHTLELQDQRYIVDGEPFKISPTVNGTRFVLMNLLTAHPDAAIKQTSAENSVTINGMISWLQQRHKNKVPVLGSIEFGGRRYAGLRSDMSIVDNRTPPDDGEQADDAFSVGGAALFSKNELVNGKSFLRISNIPFVNQKTTELAAKLPPAMKVKQLVIHTDKRALFNNVLLEPGTTTINFINRLLANYHGEPVALAELLDTEDPSVLKDAESFARRLQAQGIIIRGIVNEKPVLSLWPVEITDKRSR